MLVVFCRAHGRHDLGSCLLRLTVSPGCLHNFLRRVYPSGGYRACAHAVPHRWAPVDGPSAQQAAFEPQSQRVQFGRQGDLCPNASRWSDGIRKIEFNPARQSVIPGSVGLGAIWHLTVSRPSGTILVSGISEKGGNAGCGTYEIDPDAGTLRTLRAGAYPNCAGGGGAISPDGKHILSSTGEELSVIDLSTGAVEVVEGLGAGLAQRDVTWRSEVSWSPDGRWIAAILNHSRIVLIDAADTSKRRNIGAAGNGPLEWSQDSKYLLLLKSELRCATSLYFESLQVLEVATGKRQLIKSSHCEIGPGWVGWMDPETLR